MQPAPVAPHVAPAYRFPLGEITIEQGSPVVRLREVEGAYWDALQRQAADAGSNALLLAPSLGPDSTVSFGQEAQGTVDILELLAATGHDSGARIALAARAVRTLLRARDHGPVWITPWLLRYSRARDSFVLLWMPVPVAPLAAWFQSHELAWIWTTREVLLGKPALRPAQSYAAVLQHMVVGSLLPSCLSRLERFEAVLTARTVPGALFRRRAHAALPLSMRDDVEALAQLLNELCQGASVSRLTQLDRTLAELEPDALARAFESAGGAGRARELRLAIASVTNPAAAWRVESDANERAGRWEASVAACLSGMRRDDPFAESALVALVRRAAGEDRAALRRVVDAIPPEVVAGRPDVLAPLLGHLALAVLHDPARARRFADVPVRSALSRGALGLLNARLALEEQNADGAIAASQAAVADLATMPASRAAYGHGIARLFEAIARFVAMERGRATEALPTAFQTFCSVAMEARAPEHRELRDAACQWLAHLGRYCEEYTSPQAEAVRWGAPAVLSALGASAMVLEGSRPTVPDCDLRLLLPDSSTAVSDDL